MKSKGCDIMVTNTHNEKKKGLRNVYSYSISCNFKLFAAGENL